LLDSLQICPNRVAQGPIAWALTGLADWRAENRARLARLGTSFAKAMAKLDGWRIRSIGSYFAYVEHPFPDREGTEVAQRLAEERGILVLPASFFGPGQSRFVRIAFANLADADVEPVVARIGGLSKLPPLDGRAASPAMAKRRLAKG
jgi:aspartate/methionine/tyrosine aminotransferase